MRIGRRASAHATNLLHSSLGAAIVWADDKDYALHPPESMLHHEPLHLAIVRSEEHTSELQSLAYLVCRLLLEKKNYEFHHLRWIIGELPHSDEPSKVPLEATKVTI